MSKLSVTDFSQRRGSPFKPKNNVEEIIIHEEIQKSHFDRQKVRQSELLEKANRKAAEIQSNKPANTDGCFTEVVSYGAFNKNNAVKPTKPPANETNGTKSPLLGFPSSANDLALDAKTDLESDPNISKEVKEKVIEKLFTLVSMVQHIYESKVRVMSELEKYKDMQMKNENRREKEHSEHLFKLNMNFQSEVIQAIQQLRSELDISKNVAKSVESDNGSSVEFNSARISEDNSSASGVVSNVFMCDV